MGREKKAEKISEGTKVAWRSDPYSECQVW